MNLKMVHTIPMNTPLTWWRWEKLLDKIFPPKEMFSYGEQLEYLQHLIQYHKILFEKTKDLGKFGQVDHAKLTWSEQQTLAFFKKIIYFRGTKIYYDEDEVPQITEDVMAVILKREDLDEQQGGFI